MSTGEIIELVVACLAIVTLVLVFINQLTLGFGNILKPFKSLSKAIKSLVKGNTVKKSKRDKLQARNKKKVVKLRKAKGDAYIEKFTIFNIEAINQDKEVRNLETKLNLKLDKFDSKKRNK